MRATTDVVYMIKDTVIVMMMFVGGRVNREGRVVKVEPAKENTNEDGWHAAVSLRREHQQ